MVRRMQNSEDYMQVMSGRAMRVGDSTNMPGLFKCAALALCTRIRASAIESKAFGAGCVGAECVFRSLWRRWSL